jgi:hypothetical protein
MKTGNMAENWIASDYKTEATTVHHPAQLKLILEEKREHVD